MNYIQTDKSEDIYSVGARRLIGGMCTSSVWGLY